MHEGLCVADTGLPISLGNEGETLLSVTAHTKNIRLTLNRFEVVRIAHYLYYILVKLTHGRVQIRTA